VSKPATTRRTAVSPARASRSARALRVSAAAVRSPFTACSSPLRICIVGANEYMTYRRPPAAAGTATPVGGAASNAPSASRASFA
jgi:hypothetical protein